MIGSDWSTYVYYGFETLYGSGEMAVARGRGHYQGYNGTTFGVWTTYYGLGYADEGGGGASIPRGNVADYSYLEGQCVNTVICAGYFWV